MSVAEPLVNSWISSVRIRTMLGFHSVCRHPDRFASLRKIQESRG